MSKTVDSRVLEMRFDNKQFEAGVATSMSTLDKLKQKLNLTSSVKGLDNISKSAKKVDLSGLSSGVESVSAKFSAMQVVGVTALANITNSAVNAGKRMINALTLEPVMSGFNEYELKINSIQTVMANTASKGTTMADVTKVLDELNSYADRTIYNFAEMTRNIGTFTAAGVGLEDSAAAIQGISNLAAMSGSTSQQAATAMYQLSQALASGTVKLMDWNSVVNAGMGGEKFQNALKQTAREMGIAVDALIEKNGSFRESLHEGWLSADVLNTTLKKLTVEGAKEYSEAMLKSGKYTQEQADALMKEAQMAEDAATKIKTFSQLWSTMRESVQSGWAVTWELIIGNFEEAQEILTPLGDFMVGLIEKFSDARNNLLKSGLAQGFGKLADTFNKIVSPVKKVTDSVGKVSEKIEKTTSSMADLGKVVDDVILGKFGDGKKRFDALTKSGQNFYRVQNEVNKKLGNSHRYTQKQIDAQDKLLGIQKKSTSQQKKVNKTTKEATEETTKLTDAQKEQIKELAKLSDEQLAAKGYTEDQIDAFRELRQISKDLGLPMEELIDNLDKINGRWLLWNSFKNIGESIIKIFSSIGKGFREVFEPIKPEQLFDALAALHKFTSQLAISDETADKLTRTFKGLFAILNLITTIFGGAFKIVFSVISSLLDGLGVGVLDVTATIGDMVSKFNEWFKDNIFTKFINTIVEKIPVVIGAVRNFIDSLNIGENAAGAFKTVCEGVAAAIDIIYGAVSRSLNVSLKILGSVLSLFGTNLGELAEKIANIIIKIRDWLKENTIFVDSINKIANIITKLINAIASLVKQFLALEPVKDLINDIKNAITGIFSGFDFSLDGSFLDNISNAIDSATKKISNWLKTLSNSEHFGMDFVTGLVNGLISGIKSIASAIGNIASKIIDTLCNILGIHSPSTVAHDIGENVDEGLLNGLKSGLGKIVDFVKGIATKIIDMLKNINIGDIVVIGSIAAFLLMLKKFLGIAEGLSKALTNTLNGLGNVFNSFAGVLKSTSKWIDAKTLTIKSNAILNYAKAIGILAASIWVLSTIDTGALVKATIVLGVLVGLIAMLTMVAAKAQSVGGFDSLKLSGILMSLSFSLILLSAAMKILGTMDSDEATAALSSLIIMVGSMALVIAAFGKFVDADKSGNMKKAGQMLTKMAIAIGILAVVMKLIASMTWSDIGKGLTVITGAMLLLTAFTVLGGLNKNGNVSKVGTMLLSMSIAIGILVGVIKLIAGIPAGNVLKGLLVITTIELLFAALMVLSNLAGKNAAKAGAMFLMMSMAIGILTLTIKAIADIPGGDITKATAVIAGILIVFGAVMVASSFAGKNAAKAGAMFLMMSIAIGILALTIKLLAGIPEGDINKAYGVILSVEIMFAAFMLLSSKVGANADKAGSMMIKMSAAILIIAGAIALLSILDPSDVVRGTACISLLLGMFAAIMYASQYTTSAQKTIMMIAVCIGLLAAAVVALSFLDQSKVITATACLSALLGMFALIEAASKNVTKSMSTIIAMSAAIAILAGCLYLVAQLPVAQSLAAAASLSLLMTTISAALVIVSKVKTVTPNALVALAAMIAALGLIGLVLGLMQAFNITPSIETAAALSLLLISLSAACLILAGVGSVAPLALQGALALDGVIVVLGALMVGIGALMEYVPALETFLDKGIVILGKIGEGLGLFIGKFAGGIIEGVSSSLPALGTNLGSFMTNAKPFFDGLSGMDPNVAESAKSLAVAVLAITGSNILEKLTSWLTGGTDMADFGDKLVGLGKAMKDYSVEVAGLDVESITASASAASALVKVANALPKEGGIWQMLAGEKDIGSFGTKLVAFGKGMKDYAASVAGIDTESITASATAAEGLTKVANALPKEGGIWQEIAGSKDIGTFGTKLEAFGKGMAKYSKAVEGINAESITASATAAEGITKVANEIPKEGGLWQMLAGDKDISSFGTKLEEFGNGMAAYGDAVAGIDFGAIDNSVSAVSKLTEAIEKTVDIDLSGVDKFVAGIASLSIAPVSAVAEAFASATEASKLVNTGINMIKSVATGMSSAKTNIVNAAQSIASAGVNAIRRKKNEFKAAGTELLSSFITGLKSKNSSIEGAGKGLANSAINGVKSGASGMETAGANLGSGLVIGINSKRTSVWNAAYALGQLAVTAEKEGQNSNSPSKDTIKAGGWLGEGLVIGMRRMFTTVKNVGRDMGQTSVSSISKAISKVGNLIDSDLDVQPTISPVMDLSNVESGVGAINGMFGQTFGVGASGNLNAINTMMNRRIQNGVNDDVVSAINDLKKTISGSSGDSYNIDGITYDDGSNVADAVKSLVRAAKIERRI